jgi:hypothetical protein
MPDALFADYGRLGARTSGHARKRGLDVERFEADRRSDAGVTASEWTSGGEAGVATMPTLFAGRRSGTRSPLDLSALERLVQRRS